MRLAMPTRIRWKGSQAFQSKEDPMAVGRAGQGGRGWGRDHCQFLARYGMEVVDCGPGLISIHTPYELTSKVDLYNTYRAYKVFFEMV